MEMEALARRSSLSISVASLSRPSSRYGVSARRDFPGARRRKPSLRLRVEAETALGSARIDRSEPVEVIGIGSRKDALIEFCLNSPSFSESRLRFWTIQTRGSLKLQRCRGTDMLQKKLEFPLSHPCPPAIILVASSGHDLDHVTALELLDAVKSAGGLAVAILLKPFMFEGQRRLKEVEYLERKLKACSHFYIDTLLKREVETLAEAMETANSAVFFALWTISVMITESFAKYQSLTNLQMREVKSMEVVKILRRNGEAKSGFGAGYDIKSSIKQAIFHCPFLPGGIKDLNGLVIVTFSSASYLDQSDLHSAIVMFREISQCKSEIIVSQVQEPQLESNLVITTVLIVGNQKISSPKRGVLMSLALRLPFLSSLMGGGNFFESKEDMTVCASKSTSDASNPSENWEISNFESASSAVDYHNQCTQEIENTLSGEESRVLHKVKSSDCNINFLHKHSYETEHDANIQNEPPSSLSDDPGFHIAQLWAKERTSLHLNGKANETEILSLPIGIKTSILCSGYSMNVDLSVLEKFDNNNNAKESTSGQAIASGNVLTEAGMEAVLEIYNSALALIKGRNLNGSQNGGLLSARAASMLEAERESQKSWTPVLEIQYRGGSYKGRCQGGLPEGKGRLMFKDGCFYDGIWHNGKRCGLGSFYFSNGDVYQGSWRDDLMHGKGWFYFSSGDRWFANFWKGKANGEGRFYSKSGSIYFGNFKNGWRDGHSLYIDTDGSRWTEVWEEGTLVSRTQLDDAASG
ncbi:protein ACCUMULATION AND REPLICATION OF CHLOROPLASTS 3-like isoform X2 [Zingiber officinale]|uniref:protein ACCUMULATION AND REPLICATION OF CHLOROPLASTS 3-like isoform X2 n=1 Tax=Zingiber officinale TaxID=94328 RepID=UPI001C4D9C0F|nr:protein ACCUMULATION AND REPLICATION OF CHLOROPLASTS 3-like isoform X2 [Zingiber officinale]